MRHLRAVVQPRLGDGVGEHRHVGQAHEALHQGHLRLALRHDEVPHVDHPVPRRGVGDVEQVHRGGELHPLRHHQHQAVGGVGGVHRGEGVLLRGAGAPEEPLHQRRFVRQRAGEREQPDAGRQAVQVRERRRHAPVHHHQPGPLGVAEEVVGQSRGRTVGRSDRPEVRLRDRRHRRELPVLVLLGREAGGAGAGDAGPPPLGEPGGGRLGRGEGVPAVEQRRHAVAPAAGTAAPASQS